MRFIVDDLLYDTEKASLLCTGQKDWEDNRFYGVFKTSRKTYLYKTKKGNYFFVYVGDYDTYYMRKCTESEAKTWFSRVDYDAYVKVFGELDEA